MHYLFGDSTPSKLTTNFLEFLRAALEFSVVALQTDDRIEHGRARAAALSEEAEAEIERLECFVHVITGTIERTDKGEPHSPTAQCAKRLVQLTADAHHGTSNAIRQRLAAEHAVIDNEEAAAREPCVQALEALLVPHDPPEVASVTKVILSEDGGRYAATLSAHASFGLEWLIELEIPDGNLWSSAIHVSRISPQMEIRAPQLSGWISKEVKVKPQRIERLVVTELVDDRRTLNVKLRGEPSASGAPIGYDLEIQTDPEPKIVEAVRIGPAEDASSGAFAPAEEDVAPLVELASKLRAATADFPRRSLIRATTGGSDFRAQPTFVESVKRLIAMMAPIVRELDERSLTPNELIMRRPLGDGRREEVFIGKGTLRDIYGVLEPEQRALFAPLGLDGKPSVATPARSHKPAPPGEAKLPSPAEATLATPADAKPPSVPPPLPQPAPTSAAPPAPPPPSPALSSVAPSSVSPEPTLAAPASKAPPAPPRAPASPPAQPFVAPAHAVPPHASLPAVPPPPPSSPASAPPPVVAPPAVLPPPQSGPPSKPVRSRTPPPGTLPQVRMPPKKESPGDAPSIEIAEESAATTRDPRRDPISVRPPPPLSSPPTENRNPSRPPSAFPPPLPDGHARNLELVAELKRILALNRNGQVDEAYGAFRELITHPRFGSYRAEEQRQALRLMLVPKTKPPMSAAVLEAYAAAVERVEALVSSFDEAADYELLGVTQLALDDVESAREAFTTALAIERRRNPQSDLVGTLMRRVSEI